MTHTLSNNDTYPPPSTWPPPTPPFSLYTCKYIPTHTLLLSLQFLSHKHTLTFLTMGSVNRDDVEVLDRPLLAESGGSGKGGGLVVVEEEGGLKWKVWIETKKLWNVAGPSIIGRLTSYSMNIATQAFAGHLGDIELASVSIANTVIVGFNFGLLVLYMFTPHRALIYIF